MLSRRSTTSRERSSSKSWRGSAVAFSKSRASSPRSLQMIQLLDERLVTVHERVRIGRLPVDRVTFVGALDAVERLIAQKRGGTVFTPNVDHVVMAEHDPAFCEAYEAATLSLVDGMPVLWASRLLGAALPEKISGSDFVPALLDRAPSRAWRVYLLGGAPGSAERAAQVLAQRNVNVVGVASPRIDIATPDSFDAITDAIMKTSPDLVLIGLGAPKQEHFA